MLEAVIAIIKTLTPLISVVSGLGPARRKKLAGYCESISKVLDEYYSASPDRRRSIDLCSELRNYVTPIREAAAGAKEGSRIEALANALNGVCDALSRIRATGGEKSTGHEEDLDEIARGAGAFRGFAVVLRGG